MPNYQRRKTIAYLIVFLVSALAMTYSAVGVFPTVHAAIPEWVIIDALFVQAMLVIALAAAAGAPLYSGNPWPYSMFNSTKN